jgi:hypothetical protein
MNHPTNSQIPFESYEAAYEEVPEEDRKSFFKTIGYYYCFLVAPIDGTIISYLISQVKLTFLISMKFSMIFQGSYIHGFNKNNITDIYSRTAFIS